MRTELKNVADAGGCGRTFIWRQRPLLDRVRFPADYDLVDLVEREARNLDRRFFEDQLLKFDLQLIEIPFAFLREPINREAEEALFLLV